MSLGNDRGLLISNPFKRTFIRAIGDIHFGRVLRFLYLKQSLAQLVSRPSNILDAGCGRGEITQYLAKRYESAQVIGFDLNPSDLALANNAGKAAHLTNLTFLRHDAQAPLAIDAFDLTISWEVLHCVPNDIEMLENLYKSLRSRGVCLLHVMHKTGAYQRIGARRMLELDVGDWQKTGQVRAGYTEEELENKLKSAGFARISVRPTFGPIGMFAHSLFEVGRRLPTPLYLLLFPFLVLLGHADLHLPKSTGGGVLAIAWKD